MNVWWKRWERIFEYETLTLGNTSSGGRLKQIWTGQLVGEGCFQWCSFEWYSVLDSNKALNDDDRPKHS